MNRARYILLLTVWCGIVVSCGRLSHNDVQALYEQGKALREQGEPAEAMAVFIRAAHSETDDETLLGRIYSNMANMCRQANEHGLACYVYALSAEHFAAAKDDLAHAYALNNMAWEQAAMHHKDSAWVLVDAAVQVYPMYPLTDKIIETCAAACLFAEEYDSVLYYTSPAANDYLKMLRAQAFAYLDIGDSAVIYARELLPRTDNPFYLDDIYYILTHNDATADAEAIRELSSERADVQKAIEQRHGKLMQAMQLLADDLASPRRNMRPLLEALLLAFGCLVIAVTGITVLRERRKLYRESSAHEQARREEFERTASMLRTAENLRDELKWNDYEAFCRQTDKLFRGLATILDKEGLNEQDVRICVLVLIGLSGKQIAAMLPCSQKSIGKLKDLTARKLGVSGGKLQKKLQSIVCGW